jgi:hypothetical protein
MSEFTSRDFAKPDHHEFAKELRQVNPSYSQPFYKLFEDFNTMAAITFQQGVRKMIEGKIDDKLEADYMVVVGRYERERVKHFAHALGVMTSSLEEETHDFLGEVAGRAGVLNHWAGQFFTPWPICKMMSKLTLGDLKEKPEHRLTVSEPAVGGGAMLLAVAADLRAMDFGPWSWWFDAIDIDRRCFNMAYVQLSLCGCPGIVRNGDTLRMEFWDAWLTPTGAMFPHFWPSRGTEDHGPKKDITVPTKKEQKRVARQMELL